MKSIIHELHIVEPIAREHYDELSDEKEYKKREYENYKKLFKKFCGKLYRIKK